MQKFPKDWTEIACIEFLQRKIIIQSICYYKYNVSLTSDENFDVLAMQLVAMQKDYKGDIMDTRYGYVMYDFEGSTGFDLYNRLNYTDKNYLEYIALFLINNPPKKPGMIGALF